MRSQVQSLESINRQNQGISADDRNRVNELLRENAKLRQSLSEMSSQGNNFQSVHTIQRETIDRGVEEFKNRLFMEEEKNRNLNN